MKNIFSKTTAEKRTQNGVKTDSKRTNYGYTILLFAFLTLGFGQAWAGAGFYEVYFTYSYNSTNTNKTCKSSGTETTDLGTLTADFEITSMYLKYWKDGSGNMCGGLVEYYINSDQEYQPSSWTWTAKGGNDHELSSTATWTVAKYNEGASGSYTFWYRFKTWGSTSSSSGCNQNFYVPTDGSSKNKFTYKIAPPALNSFTITPTGKVAGSGTSEDPYIIPYGGDLTLVSSGGTKARTDDNSSVEFSLNNSTWGTTSTNTTTTIENITSTSTTSVNLYARCKNNSDASLLGAVKTQTIYYRAAALNTITLNKGTDGTSAGSMTIREYATAYTSYTPATKTGWSLKGYYTTVSDGTQIIDANGNLLSNKSGYTNSSGQWIGGTTTLYAQWKQTYAVTYYANFPAGATSTSGSVPTDATEYASGATVTVKTNSGSLAAGGFTFAGWNTEAEGTGTDRAVSSTFSITGNTALYAKWTENMRNVTISAGTGGTVDKTSANVGVATTTTVTATAYPGYRFTGWTATNCNVASTSSASTTLSGNGTAGSGTLVANFERTYAYIEGRMTVYNAARSTETHVGSSKGKWSESSFNIAMDYDATNHRFRRHTYKTPAELSATQTDETAQSQWFSIARSNTSGSWSGKTTYHPSSNTDLTTTGSANKKAAQTSTTTNNYKFNSSTSDGYAILYFDEAGVWYELEHTLKYNANSGTGSAPAEAYYNHGANATAAAANTFSRTGYTFNGWKTGASSGTSYAAGASVPMNSNITLYAQWQINNHAVTYTAPSHGSYTIKVGDAAAVSANTTSDYGKQITLAANPATGYHFVSWSVYKTGEPATIVTVTSNQFTMPDYPVTVSATFTANTYSVTFDANGGTGDAMSPQAFTYDVTLPLSANTYTRTGYDFDGWATAAEGAKVYDDGENVNNLTPANGGTFPLYAHWTAKSYTVTLDKQTDVTGYGGTEGTVGDQTVTFDAIPATVTGSMPTAAQGYCFMGFYSAEDGGGRQFINPSGEWVTDAGDTISSGNWVRDGGITLYAYYKKAEITNLSFDAAVVAPSASVGVTPTVAPTPEGTNSICWKLLYNNGNLYTPQPTFSPANPGGVGNKVTFNAPPTSGMYLVAAVLRTGSSCDGGTKLDSVTYPFQVAGDHTVTIQYKCGDVTLQGAKSISARPLVWSEEITPDEIFGYSFEKWVAGDGVTMTINGGETTIETGGETPGKATTHAVQIKAIYDGKLIAKYTKKNIIYFKNTLGWSEVYVNIMSDSYWNGLNGSGNQNTCLSCNRQMTLLEGTDDIYYLEYSGSTSVYMSFTSMSQNDAANFWASDAANLRVVYPTRPNDDGSEQTNYGYNAGTPMFVPTAEQTPVDKNINYGGKASYYNKGYWRKYDPIQGETGYTLKVYDKTDADGRKELKSIKFVESDVSGQLFKAVADLEAAGDYGIKFERDNSMLYTNASGHLHRTGDVVITDKQDDNYAAIRIKATAAGDYTFAITINGDGKLCIQAEFPVAKNDYRVIYTDNDTWTEAHTAESWVHPSRIITAEAGAVDTISFFVSKDHSPEFKIQRVSNIDEGTGAITWTDVTSWTSCDDVDASGVYNFIFTQDESKNIRFTKKEPYTGNFYIRTDAAGSTKWDNYRAADHLMTYSEYSKDHSDYTHYFVKFVSEGTNVKFVVANDYSPCISDTLKVQTYRDGDSYHVNGEGFLNGDLPGDGANVRYMWDIRNNAVYRAYLAPAQRNGSKFLVLRSNSSDDLRDEHDEALTGDSYETPGNSHGGGANCMQFVDNENWIYEATVMVRPSAYVKLYGHFHDKNFYFKGNNNNEFNGTKIDGIPNAIQLVTGSTGSRVKVRVIYDFKTDRLVAAYLPSGNIDEQMAINADVMFIREHQGDIDQLTFSEKDSKMGAITDIKTAYAVMRFNKWTLNNKDKNTHGVLANPKSIYERSLYYVSFPFPVNLNEVFGFGTYGQHWIIQRYRGDLRAQQGFWAESAGFWEFIWNRNGVVLQPNEGYILTLETELLGETSDVWGPESVANQVELYFPSHSDVSSITNASITQTLPAHKCTINRAATEGLPDTSDPSTSYNRTIFDSHWNIMSVPTYVNVNNPSLATTTWLSNDSCPKFLYTWNPDDNTLTATSGTGFMYHAMHAYTVQYYGDVTWTTSVTPTAAPQRNTEYRGEYEFCLEVQQDDQMIDRTFVRLSDDEKVTTGFEFGEDMTKQFNSRKANIFTIAGNTSLGGNSLPLSTTQTTVVPVGVSIKSAGDYTFAIPEGTEGIGVTLVDNETGVRTSLSALDYTVTLQPGNITDRFVLEISPIHNTPTGLEEPTSDSSLKGRAQKVMIDGILYIVKDGKIFDARGARVE